MGNEVRFLVVDGYSRAARDELVAGGASLAADLYADMLRAHCPGAVCDVLFPSDPGATLPDGAALEQYDGVAWTGCSLTIFEADRDPHVRGQIDLARRAYELGIPSFGSCWGAQMAVVAAGGLVAAHPDGREMGVARKIRLTADGRGPPLYEGKPSVFDGYISHVDEVTHLPPGAVRLAGNAWTRVQAVAVTHGRGTFWGLQYHPEYDLHEMARLVYCRIDKLMRDDIFRSREDALSYVDLLEALHADPGRKDLAWRLGVDADVLDPTVRQCEVRNWVRRLVLPVRRER